MKIIKDKNIDKNLQEITSYIRIVVDDYILLDTEEDITTTEIIEYLFNIGVIDYKGKRRCYKYLANNFNNLDEITKENICKFCATSAVTIVTYYISKGMSLQDAKIQYLSNRSMDILESAKCCETYLDSPKFIKTLIYYLPINDAERFLDDTRDLSYKYRTVGHFGISYGDTTEGLFDFITCYGSYENSGLKNYTLNSGLTLEDFQNDLLDILYYGII